MSKHVSEIPCMADEQDNPGDLRIPFSMTVPWTGKVTRGGQPWPLDRQGRYWPSSRWGQPTRPLDEFPPDFPAPGTGKRSMTVGEAAQLYLSLLEVEKAAYAKHGSKPALTLTVRPGGTGRDVSAARVAQLGQITVILSGIVLAVGTAPEVLPTLAALTVAAITIELLGEVLRFLNGQAAAAFLSGGCCTRLTSKGLTDRDCRRSCHRRHPRRRASWWGSRGWVPPAPTPAQPGFTPAPPIPLVPPDAVPHPAIGMVMESRKSRLGEGGRERVPAVRGRRRGGRIRRVVRHLEEAEWRAHHLINIAAIVEAKDLIDAAVRAGWRTDGESNTAAVPYSAEAQRKLQAAGVRRPVHNSGHSGWNRYVRARLGEVNRRIDNTKFESERKRDEEN